MVQMDFMFVLPWGAGPPGCIPEALSGLLESPA
ncbi:hypothetical protein L903_17775 [Agrobacterium sp. JL28]|nr:hypothetical protein L903_17775 [Agrobacterium sp. JL28]KVK50518.1 hypothetical protein L904_17780 [Agrobacterium sp. LY4]KVK60158.1 hypothetical protein L906_23170 [Agrobacterium sp. TS45]